MYRYFSCLSIIKPFSGLEFEKTLKLTINFYFYLFIYFFSRCARAVRLALVAVLPVSLQAAPVCGVAYNFIGRTALGAEGVRTGSGAVPRGAWCDFNFF